MFKDVKEVMEFIRENDIKMVDFKMVDISGAYRHVTIPAARFSEEYLTDGVGFDASNYGYAVVEKSDMVFIPDVTTAMVDPFCEIPTLSMTGNAMIIDYPHNRPLPQYPRNIVLAAQQEGLNTCWVAGTYKKGKCRAEKAADEKIICVIAIGYGENQGTKHKSKPLAKLCSVKEEDMPGWFRNGVKGAMMAPTAMNQQKFTISLEDGEAVITAGRGPLTKIDLGIVKYNFEAASGHTCRTRH